MNHHYIDKKEENELRRRGIYGPYQYSLFPKPVIDGPFNRYPFYNPTYGTRTKSKPPQREQPRAYKIKK